MESKIIEKIEKVLHSEGFANFSKHSSQHTSTLSGDKGRIRFVLHFADDASPPARAGVNSVPLKHAAVHTKPIAFGLATAPSGAVTAMGGQGGSVGKTKANRLSKIK